MNLLNLFDGIGGFALAAEWMGWHNVASCEIDPFCRRVLDYHFKYEYIYEDIKQADFTGLRGRIDLVTGGFPCQPFSLAGKQQGTDDNRYLFPEMFRVIREVQPRWIVAENVRGLVTQQGGLVFEQVCSDLESAGYEVQPFILPACAVNAPHRRDRVWIVAHRADTGIKGVQGGKAEVLPAIDASYTDRNRQRYGENKQEYQQECQGTSDFGVNGHKRIASDTRRNGRLEGELHTGKPKGTQENQGRSLAIKPIGADSTQGWWREFPTESPVCSGNDGLSGRLDGITFPKWREETIKSFGNAVVPQAVLQIFMAIAEYERSIQ